MTFKSYVVGGASIIEVDDYRLDNQNSEMVNKRLMEEIENKQENIIIDLKNVDFISSYGIGMLLAFNEKLKERGGKLFLTSLTGNVGEIFTLSGIIDMFKVFKSADAAVKIINKNG